MESDWKRIDEMLWVDEFWVYNMSLSGFPATNLHSLSYSLSLLLWFDLIW